MTVCIAALAEDSRAIVLVADKALTYGGITRPALQGETGGIEKMLPIGDTGWSALFAGNPSVAEDVTTRLESKLMDTPTIGESFPDMMEAAKTAFQEIREQGVLDRILTPNLLAKESFLTRTNNLLPLQDDFFVSLAQEVGAFVLGTTLLISGFDSEGDGHIFLVSDPGVAQSQAVAGFAAIGIGNETANARLLWNASEPEDDLDIAMYQVFEAKTYAEQIQGVGGFSDMWVGVSGVTRRVPLETQDLLKEVVDNNALMPFRSKSTLTTRRQLPKGWEEKLGKAAKRLKRTPRKTESQSKTARSTT